MSGLRKAFWPITHAAARWGVFVPELFEAALSNDLGLSIIISPVPGADGEVFRGIVGGDAAELWRLAPRAGAGRPTVEASRIYADGFWRLLPQPVLVTLADVVIADEERQSFEDRHELIKQTTRPGPDFKYRWVELLQWLAIDLHENGVPATQAELLDRCRDWLIENSPDGEHPTDRSIRTYVAPVWRGLKREADE